MSIIFRLRVVIFIRKDRNERERERERDLRSKTVGLMWNIFRNKNETKKNKQRDKRR